MDDPSELIFGDDDFLLPEELELLDDEFPDIFDEDSSQEEDET